LLHNVSAPVSPGLSPDPNSKTIFLSLAPARNVDAAWRFCEMFQTSLVYDPNRGHIARLIISTSAAEGEKYT